MSYASNMIDSAKQHIRYALSDLGVSVLIDSPGLSPYINSYAPKAYKEAYRKLLEANDILNGKSQTKETDAL